MARTFVKPFVVGVLVGAAFLFTVQELFVPRAPGEMKASKKADLYNFRGPSSAPVSGVEEVVVPSPAPLKKAIHHRAQAVQRLLFTDPKCQQKTPYVAHLTDAVVVEVGSYKGEELVQFRGHVKKIVTYEPNPRKIQDITDRVKVEGLAAFTTIRNAAVTNFSGKVTLYLPNGAESQQDMMGPMNFNTNEPLGKVEIDGVRLDDEIHEHVHLLKVDTQGHEFQVLQGAAGLIEKHGIDVLHLEFSPNLMRSNGADPVEMLQWLSDAGYVCFYCAETFTTGDLPKFDTDPVWDYTTFTSKFGPFYYGGVNHGMWGDLVCI